MASASRPDKTLDPSFRKVLLPWRDETIAYLTNRLRELFKSADQVLLEFADKAQNNKVQNHFFEAMRELWLKQESVVSNFQDGLERHIFAFRERPDKNASLGADTLSLVSKENFEKSLALQTIADQAEKKNYAILYPLAQRLAVVNDGHKVKLNDVPAGPSQLADVFEKCAEVIFVEKEVRLVLYTLFDRFVIRKADRVYEDLNQRLIDAGVLPDLKYNFTKQPSAQNRATNPTGRANGQSGKCDPESTLGSAYGDAPAGTPGSEAGDAGQDDDDRPVSHAEVAEQTFDRIKELLSVQRAHSQTRRVAAAQQSGGNVSAIQGSAGASTGSGGSGEESGGVSYASHSEVGEIILSDEVVQQAPLPDTRVRDEAVRRVEVDAQLLMKINETLKKQRQLIKKLVGQERMASDDEDVIDIVGMLFELMLNDQRLPNVVKTLLSHLHTPFLKIAVEDSSFLTDHEHPARRLFELMITVGSEWVDENNLLAGIYPQLQVVVNRILGEKSVDRQLLEKLAHELHNAHALLTDKTRITEERTLEAEKGRAKLEQAKAISLKAIRELLHGRQIIPSSAKFMTGPWVDYMTLVLLRSDFNKDSASWQQALKMGEKLRRYSLSSHDSKVVLPTPGLLQELATELKQNVGSMIPHYQHEIDEFLKSLADSKQRSESTQLDEVGEDIAIDTEAAPADTAGTPGTEVQKFIEQLRALEPGTWFILKPEGADSTQRVKMSWYNPITANFLFVDQAGIKAAVKNIRALAGELASGQAKILDKPSKPFIERSMGAIRSLLEKTSQAVRSNPS